MTTVSHLGPPTVLGAPALEDTGGLKSGDSFEDGSFPVESVDVGKCGK